jgi:hypothetical protein
MMLSGRGTVINEERLLPISQYTRPEAADELDKEFEDPRGIVLHWWEALQSLEDNWNWFNTNPQRKRYGSANVTIKDGLIRMVPDLEYAFHVGSYYYTPEARRRFGSDPGAHLLSIEMGHKNMEGEPSQLTEHLAEQQCALWVYKYDLNPFYDILTHWHVTYKCTRNGPCHRWYVEDSSRLYGPKGFCEKVKSMAIHKDWSFA